LNSLARACNSAGGSGIPLTMVTPLPFRPFVSRLIRTILSPPGTKHFFWAQIHPDTGLPHRGHMAPCSVEYTVVAYFCCIDCFPNGIFLCRLHTHSSWINLDQWKKSNSQTKHNLPRARDRRPLSMEISLRSSPQHNAFSSYFQSRSHLS
jgi:hypothetical protein